MCGFEHTADDMTNSLSVDRGSIIIILEEKRYYLGYNSSIQDSHRGSHRIDSQGQRQASAPDCFFFSWPASLLASPGPGMVLI